MAAATRREIRTVPIPQAARELGISRSLAYKLARLNRFPCRIIRAGNRLLVPTAELDRVLGLPPERAAQYEAAG